MEVKLPWWRWALEFALGGIRSGFGLFRRNGRVEVGSDTRAEAFVAEPENERVELSAEENAEPESSLEPENRQSELGSITEDPAEAEIEEIESIAETSVAEEHPEPDIALIGLEEPEELEVQEEEIALTRTSPQPEESATRPTHEVAPAPVPEPAPKAQAAPAPETAPVLPFDPPVALEPTPAEPTTAEKVAAALKARGVDAEQSPFSVFVGEVYDGPLDLLLDLIRKQDIDIYDIPIAKITAQFLAYVDHLRASDMDVAGEFIYTAALLIHIKSKMLLPRAPVGPEESTEDPRRELVDRLL
ncbi:MAG: segregation/condensation protein A, partial [Terracidiphilus sp.]